MFIMNGDGSASGFAFLLILSLLAERVPWPMLCKSPKGRKTAAAKICYTCMRLLNGNVVTAPRS